MAPTRKQPPKAVSPSIISDEASQEQSQETQTLQIQAETLAQIVQMQHSKIAKQKSYGEDKIHAARKRRIERIQMKMNAAERRQHEKFRDQLRPKLDRLRELLALKRSLEAKQDEHFTQVTSAMKATVEQLHVAIHDRCQQLAE